MPKKQTTLKPEMMPVISFEVNDNQSENLSIDLTRNVINYSSEFDKKLIEIKQLVSEANTVFNLTDLDENGNLLPVDYSKIDDETLENLTPKLEQASVLNKDVTRLIKTIKSETNAYVAVFFEKIEEVLKENGFSELGHLNTELKRLKKEVLDYRLLTNLSNCYDVYMNTLKLYPNVLQMFPDLGLKYVFETNLQQKAPFKVSGAKDWKITKKINEYLVDMAASYHALTEETIRMSENLSDHYKNILISAVRSQPSIETLNQQFIHITNMIKSEEELARQRAEESERQRIAALQHQQAILNTPVQPQVTENQVPPVPPHAPIGQVNTPQEPIEQAVLSSLQVKNFTNDDGSFYYDAVSWLNNVYVPQNSQAFYDVATNLSTKLNLVKQLLKDLENDQTELYKVVANEQARALTVITAALNL